MEEAQYFHATLYRFAPSAYEEVIERFHGLMQDASARCWYDIAQDAFCIKSPALIGHIANSALNEAVRGYIEAELAAAEREDRSATIQRLGVEIVEDELILSNDKQGTSKDGKLVKACAARPITLHYVHLEGAGSSTIKLFKICELHGGLVDRVLSPNDSGAKKVMQHSMTARVVSWNQRKQLYFFNGRYGEPVGISSSPRGIIINTSHFAAVHDLRATDGCKANTDVVSARSWKFKNDDQIDIRRFLQGMGETEMEDPEATPDKPDDAARFLAHSDLPQLSQGRLRVPKVMQSENSNDDSDSDEDFSQSSDSVDINKRNVEPPQLGANLIFGTPVSPAKNVHGNTAAEAEDMKTPTLRILFPVSLDEHALAPTVATNGHGLRIIPQQSSGSSQTPLINRSIVDEPQAGTLPEYNRSYADVDKIGLSGNAPNQATWEHENPSPKKKATVKSGITRRLAAASSDSQASEHIANPGAHARISRTSLQSSAISTSSLSPASPSTLSNNGKPTGSQNWSNNVVRPNPAGPKLVDDTVGSTRVSPKDADADHFAGLIAAFRSKAGAASNANYRGPGLKSANHRGNDIVERLKVAPDNPQDKKYTMNQKARKPKKKKSQNNPTASMVSLPMPDPVPTMQISATRNEAAPNSISNSQDSVKPLTLNDLREKYASSPPPGRSLSRSRSSSPHHVEAPAKKSEKDITATEQLLRDVSTTSILEGAQLYVKFGMILSTPQGSNNALPKGAIMKETFQAELQAGIEFCETNFLTRLTTSTNDALFLLSDDFVPGSPASARLQYEIVIKNPDGSLSTIIMDHADRSNLQMAADSDVLGTLYMHCPIRIWDTKVTIERAVFHSPAQAAIDFVSSMQTVDEPPSFVALIPTAAFGVEKVYAKRMFSKVVQGGLELVVTEVQELALESIDDARYNVKVAALPTERMLNEQRVWWECGLRSEVLDADHAKELQDTIDQMVTKMDGVGYANKGPWTKAEVNDGQGVVEQWFW